MTSTACRRAVLTVAMAGLLALSATGVSHAVPMPLDAGLVVWLKADAAPGIANGQTFGGTSPTTLWPDVTTGAVGDGIGQDAALANGGPTYRTGQINGLPAVDFGGGGAFAYAGPIGIAGPQAPFTAIVVGSTRKTGEQRPLQIGAGPGGQGVSADVGTAGFRYNNGNNTFTDATEKFPSDASFHIGVWSMNATDTYGTSSYYRDGVAGTSNGAANGGSTTNILDTGYVVGRGIHPSSGNPHMYLTGRIAEILVYDRELTAAELNQVGYALQQKYALAGAYTAPTPLVFDNGDATDNNWMRPANWDPDAEPTVYDVAYVGNGLTARIDQAGEVAGSVVVGHNQATLAGKGTLDIDAGDLLTGDLIIGQGSASHTGTVLQDGGAATVTGNILFDATGGTQSTYRLRGGTLDVVGDIKHASASRGHFYVDGGTLSLGGDVNIQSFRTGDTLDGAFTVTSGHTLNCTGSLIIGRAAVGTLTVDDTTATANNMTVGDAGGSVGSTVTLDNGASLTVSSYLDIGDANNSSGTIHILGGSTMTANGALDLGQAGNAQGTINLIDGSLTVNNHFYIGGDGTGDTNTQGTVIVGDGTTTPTLTQTASNLEVGRGGTGIFTLESGTVNHSGGNFVIAQYANSVGTATVNSGTLTIANDLNMNEGTAVFNQNGGTVDVGRDLRLGTKNLAASTATYTLDGGTLNVGRRILIGEQGHGELNYVDGTLTLGEVLYLGGDTNGASTNRPNADGTLNLGSATTAPTLNTQQIEVGRHGAGQVNHLSGDLVVHDANLVVSQYVNSTGTYNLYDGTIGFAGTTGERSINFNHGRGVFNQYGGVVNADYGIKMAQNANEGDHEWNLHDGVVNVSGVNFELGRDAKAVFTQFGGEVNIALAGPAVNIVLGQNATGDGTYILQDGTLRLGNQLNIANRGKGTFTQEGGLVDVAKELQIGNTENQANTDGLYEMKGGTLTTGEQLRVGHRNQGVLHQTGGTVTVGTGLVVGNDNYGTTDGTYILDGGTLNVTNNLAIGHRGTGTFDFISSDVPVTMNPTRWIYVGGEGSTSTTAAPNANGTFNIGDGVSSPVLNARQFEVGRHGVGVVNQRSGTVTVHGDDNLVISQYANSDGTYHMMGGVLELGSGARGNINFNYGTGLFAQSGGRVELNGGDVNIARYNVSNSTYRLEGGTLDMGGGDIVFGLDEPNGNGTFTFTGGRLENLGAFRGPTPTLPDASGNGNDGAIEMLAPRIFGGALEFNDSNDHVDFGDVAAMSSQDAFTVSMWFQRDVDRSDATNHGIDNILIAKSHNVNNDNFELGTDGGQAEVYLDSTTGADATARYGVGVQDDVWHHIVLTYDPARDPADEMELYLDGSLVASDGRWGGNLDQSTGSPLTLGMARPDNQNWGDFDGLMDDVAIWSRAIAPAEIAALYNGGAGAPASSLAGFSDSIVLYTPMDSLDYTVTLNHQGGVIAPGASAGITAILGDYVMGEAGTYEVELGDTYVFDPLSLPTLTDFIYVGGDATLDGLLDILSLGGFDPVYGDAFDIMYAAGTIDAASLEVGSEFEHFFHISVYDYELGGQVLRLTHVPEPTTLTLVALGGLGLVARRRRR